MLRGLLLQVVTQRFGVEFLRRCDYMVASTSTFADPDLMARVIAEVRPHNVSCAQNYVGRAAAWPELG